MKSLLCLAVSAALAVSPSPAGPGDLPSLDHEPNLGVLISRGTRVSVTLKQAARLRTTRSTEVLKPGSITFEVAGEGWRLSRNRQIHTGLGVLAAEARPIFELEAIPVFGEPRTLVLAGDLEISVSKGELLVVERIPMEDYLVGVVTAEMNPSWPSEALGAQAIVARSYAAARWMERIDEPWQLHWHFGVDMAYHGSGSGREAVERAVRGTRGKVLLYRGLPVLALFHASSGGRTEAFGRIKPGVLAPDGRTPIAAAMPVIDDPAVILGASGLGLTDSHGHWKTDVPLPEVTAALQHWTTQGPDRPPIGTVEAVSVLDRHKDSGRVARVSIRHRLDGKERFTALPATDFRLAVNPVRIRSLLWDRCVIASRDPGYLVLQGRGFGHGCGLSQVSAWHLAERGASAESIVSRFYQGAKIERRY